MSRRVVGTHALRGGWPGGPRSPGELAWADPTPLPRDSSSSKTTKTCLYHKTGREAFATDTQTRGI